MGAGFADAGVLGDVFTSPSTEQVYRICKAASGGGGIMLSFGNYAGDRLNFAAAQERLIAEGIDTRIVYVTDDIASAAPEDSDKRRGIAGTFTVYKIAGAAADSGDARRGRAGDGRGQRGTYRSASRSAGARFPGAEGPAVHGGAGADGLRPGHPR